MINRLVRNSAFVLIPAALLASLLPWENMPFSILTGGLLAILNTRALAWSVGAILSNPASGMKMLFLTQFRLVMIALVVIFLAALKLVSIAGIMAGFTIVFIQVMIAGLREAKKTEK